MCGKGSPTQGSTYHLSTSNSYCDWPCFIRKFEFIERGLFGDVRVCKLGFLVNALDSWGTGVFSHVHHKTILKLYVFSDLSKLAILKVHIFFFFWVKSCFFFL